VTPLSASIAFAKWSDDELRRALSITEEIVFKATALGPYQRLAAKELRLRSVLANVHVRIARKADKALLTAFKNTKGKVTEKTIERFVSVWAKAFKGYADDVVKDVADVVAFAQHAGKQVTYQRVFGAPKDDIVYQGPPFKDRTPIETEVKVEKAATSVDPSTTLQDLKAIEQITRGQKFWIGKYHSEILSKQIQQITRDIILKQGLSSRAAGIALGEALGYVNGYIPVKPKVTIPKGWSGSTLQYFDGVAANAATVSRIHGQMHAMIELGFDRYEVVNGLDERTCVRCEAINGDTLEVRKSYQQMVEVIGGPPGAIPAGHPWLSETDFMSKYKSSGAAGLQGVGAGYPPFHFKCRCTIDIVPDSAFTTVAVPPATVAPPRAKPIQPKNPIRNLTGLGEAEGGAVPTDAEWIEHNSVNWRLEQVVDAKQKAVEQIVARMKISDLKIDEVARKLKKLGRGKKKFTEHKPLEFEKLETHRVPGQKGPLRKSTKEFGDVGANAIEFERRNVIVRLVEKSQPNRAMSGHLEIIAKTGDKEKAFKSVQKVMRELGIKNTTSVPLRSQRLAAKVRIMIARDAELGALLRQDILEEGIGVVDKYWKTFVKKNPNAKKVFKDAIRKEVAPGHSTFYSELQAKTIIDREGITHLTHDMWNEDVLMNILDGTGLLSSRNRYMRGIFTRGMSTSTDFNTGGASSVFTRLSRKIAQTDRGTIIIKPEALGRMDWYAYKFDNYGTTRANALRERVTTKGLKEASNNMSNEVMFEHGIGVDDIEAVVMGSGRDELIRKLKAKGIEKIGGRKVEDVIVKEWIKTTK
jgi:hypothetical protein